MTFCSKVDPAAGKREASIRIGNMLVTWLLHHAGEVQRRLRWSYPHHIYRASHCYFGRKVELADAIIMEHQPPDKRIAAPNHIERHRYEAYVSRNVEEVILKKEFLVVWDTPRAPQGSIGCVQNGRWRDENALLKAGRQMRAC